MGSVLLIAFGVVCVVVGAFIVHPGLGAFVLGAACICVGVMIANL